MKYLLGIDFGGGSSKATLLSHEGKVAATAVTEYPTLYPKTGYAEQNPGDWYDAVKVGIAKLIKESGVNPCDITAVCLDAATHTAVVTDDDFNVVMPSIYWTDTRSIKEAEYLKENYGEMINEKCLHQPSTIWTLPQLLWVKNNMPETFAKIKKIFFAKDYVRHMLCGDYATDFIEAEGSMLFDVNTLSWSEELCGILGFDVKNMPEVKAPTDIAGKITKKAGEDTGLLEGTTVVTGSTDTVMEVFASGAVKEGQMTLKLATAGRICIVTDKAYPDKNLVNYSHLVKGLWYPGTATKACASSYRWYRDTFGGSYKDLDTGAKETPIGADGLMYHPYLNGELTPYNDPKLCASFTGVRASHTKGHFSRAVMEGVGFSLIDCKNAIHEIGIKMGDCATIIGGGAASPIWRQIVADMLNIKLVTTNNSDSSFGSAMTAGVATGVFPSFEEAVEKCSEKVSETLPNEENHKKYLELYKDYKKIHDALAPIYQNRG